MESIHTQLALYGSKNKCTMTDTVILPISEVCNGTVPLTPKELLLLPNVSIQPTHVFGALRKEDRLCVPAGSCPNRGGTGPDL